MLRTVKFSSSAPARNSSSCFSGCGSVSGFTHSFARIQTPSNRVLVAGNLKLRRTFATEVAAGEEANGAPQPPPNIKKIVEKGHVYFFYRPRVGITQAQSLEDVQRFFVFLCPSKEEGAPDSPNRVLVIPKKKLPLPVAPNKYWGFVDKVDPNLENLIKLLESETYETPSKKTKVQPAAQPAGEGLYALVHHTSKNREHVHLTYLLESPRKLGPVQRDFNIEKQGSYIISVKNPDVETPQGRPSMSGQWKPVIPDDVKQESFGGKLRFASSSHFLNYERTEVVMIGSSSDLDREFADVPVEGDESCSSTSNKLMAELRAMEANKDRQKPINTGTWEE